MRIDITLAIVKSGKPQWQIAQAIGVPESALSKFIRGHGKLRPESEQRLLEVLWMQAESSDVAQAWEPPFNDRDSSPA